MRPRLTREQRGATLPEFALVALLFFTIVFALIDFALIEAGNTSAGNAARDGARVGIINYLCADSYPTNPNTQFIGHDGCSSPSANYTAIHDAVVKAAAGLATPGSLQVDVACLNATTATPTVEACASPTVTLGVDEIQVTVSYTSVVSTPFASGGTRTQTARMVIAGAPNLSATTTTSTPSTSTTTSSSTTSSSTTSSSTTSTSTSTTTSTTSTTSTTVPGCTFVSGSATPNPNSIQGGSGKLSSDIAVSVQTSGSCSNLTVSVPPGNGANQTAGLTGGPSSWTGTIDGSQHVWTSGAKTITVYANGTAIGTIGFTVS